MVWFVHHIATRLLAILQYSFPALRFLSEGSSSTMAALIEDGITEVFASNIWAHTHLEQHTKFIKESWWFWSWPLWLLRVW